MIEYLKGKKLLVLGATTSEISLVKRAQLFGIYVIVTDYNTDYSLSPAKYHADEVWNISWSDIDRLEQKCIIEKVDGVISGYSEIRVDCMIQLCERLGLPCYINREQLEITRDKIKFKNECKKNGLKTVNEYSSIDSVSKFPVIVKPVDRAGSIGISIANNKKELMNAFEYAMDKSISKQVIIEDYIQNGTKVDFYYAVTDGKIELITSCDTINAKNNGTERVVQSAWLYPEKNISEVLKETDFAMKKMISNMGIKYGCMFFSGFVLPKNEFVFFESGFRLEGGHQYEYSFLKGYMNFMDIFIFHSLLENTNKIEYNNEINDILKCVTINLYAKKGILSQIGGVDGVKKIPGCTLVLIHSREGEVCDDDNAILHKLGMFSFCHESPEYLKECVEKAYSLLEFKDENNNDMVYDRIDTRIILDWWK